MVWSCKVDKTRSSVVNKHVEWQIKRATNWSPIGKQKGGKPRKFWRAEMGTEMQVSPLLLSY